MFESIKQPVSLNAEDVRTYIPMLQDLRIRLSDSVYLLKKVAYSDNDVYALMRKYKTLHDEIHSILKWAENYTFLERNTLSFEEFRFLNTTIIQHYVFLGDQVVLRIGLNLSQKDLGKIIFEQDTILRDRYRQILEDFIGPADRKHKERYGNLVNLLK